MTPAPASILSAIFALSQSDAPLSLTSAQSTIRAALQRLSSGLLAADCPAAAVDGTVTALIQALCDPDLSSRIAWATVLSGDAGDADAGDADSGGGPAGGRGLAEGVIGFFAARAANGLAAGLDFRRADGAGDRVYVGTLGEATRALRSVAVVLERSEEALGARLRLQDGVLADLVFSCFRVRASGSLVWGGEEDGSGMGAAVLAVRAEARAVAAELLDRLPGVARRTRSLSDVVVRVWAADAARDGLHRHLAAGLRAEDAFLFSGDALARLSLVAVPGVVRALVEAVEDGAVEGLLDRILSIVLPVVGDTRRQRRADALVVLARCLLVCGDTALARHAPVMVAALSEALGFDDWATALDAFPSMAMAMRLVYPVVVVRGEPPGVWKEGLKDMLRAFVKLLEACQAPRVGGGEEDANVLLTVAAVARYIPEIGGVRLVLRMDAVLEAMGEALFFAGFAVGRDGAASLDVFICVKNAFVKVLLQTWPRVPAHCDVVIRAAFRAVMIAKVTEDSVVLTEVVEQAADLLFCAASCGDAPQFSAVLDGIRGDLENHESLRTGLALCTVVSQRIGKELKSIESDEKKKHEAADVHTIGKKLDSISLNHV